MPLDVGSGSNHCVRSNTRTFIELVRLPYNTSHIVGVAVDDTNHFIRDIWRAVVSHWPKTTLITTRLGRQYGERLVNAVSFQAYHHDSGFFHALGAFMGFPQIQGREI